LIYINVLINISDRHLMLDLWCDFFCVY